MLILTVYGLEKPVTLTFAEARMLARAIWALSGESAGITGWSLGELSITRPQKELPAPESPATERSPG